MPRPAALAIAFALLLMPQQAALRVRAIDGTTSTPLTPGAGATHLLFFLSADCPVSMRYGPEMERIIASYRERGVQSWLVYAEPRLTDAQARANLDAFHPSTTATVVLDRDLALTRAAGATVTPEAIVLTDAGRQYRGRIDDLYVALGQARREPTTRDLRNALDAVLAGRPVPVRETQPVGCAIEMGGE